MTDKRNGRALLPAVLRVRGLGIGTAICAVGVALLATVSAVAPAAANSCAAACYSEHNQCRIARKGSPSCDEALTQCLSRCTKKPAN